MELPARIALARRQLLARVGAGTAALALLPGEDAAAANAPGLGEPTRSRSASPRATRRRDGVVLWTRLAPEPLEPAAGCRTASRCRCAGRWPRTTACAGSCARGRRSRAPELAHSVHVEVDGLRPGRGTSTASPPAATASPVGRTRTAPAARPAPTGCAFAFATCQRLERRLLHRATRTWPRRTSTSSSTSATTSTRAARPRTAACATCAPPSCARDHDARPTTAIATRSTRPTPICRRAHARLPWVGHLGRPRGRERLRRHASRRTIDPADGVPRADAPPPTRRTTSTCRCAPQLPAAGRCGCTGGCAFGDLADLPRARHAAVPQRPALRRRRDRRAATRPFAGEHHAGRGARSAGWPTGSRRRPAALERARAAGADGRAQPPALAGAARRRCSGTTAGTATRWRGAACSTGCARGEVREPGGDHRRLALDLRQRRASSTSTGRARPRSRPSSSRRPSPATATARSTARTTARSSPTTRTSRYFEGDRKGYFRVDLTHRGWATDLRLVERVGVPGAPVRTERSWVVEPGRPGAQDA